MSAMIDERINPVHRDGLGLMLRSSVLESFSASRDAKNAISTTTIHDTILVSFL